MYIVYKTTNNINGKIYIGVHIVKDENKIDNYLGSNKHLFRAVEKYGKENFTRETLIGNLTEDEAYYIESIIVDEDFIKRKDVYNEKRGGFGGSSKGRAFHKDEEYRKKLSDGLKSYISYLKENNITHPNVGKKASDETRKKMSESHTGLHAGELNPMWGISYEDHPKGMLGKTHSQETKDKISKSGIEHYKNHPPYERTDEIRKKISESKKGMPAWNKGKPMSEEYKQNLRKPKKKCICPHCGKIGGIGNMKRYHFDYCKDKPC